MNFDANQNDQKLNPQKIFYPGYAQSAAYRIPSMITTKKGTILAGIDARIVSPQDNPNKINTRMRRSTDHGESWEEIQELISYPGEGLHGAAAIDTALLQDEETETIWLLVCHTPGGVGLWNSEAGIGFDQKGRKILLDACQNRYFLDQEGLVWDAKGQKTSYKVDVDGNMFLHDEPIGNIYFKEDIAPGDSFLEARTSFLQLIKSDDDGLTWSDPIDLNPQVKEEWMKFIGAGPGRGLQIKNGSYKGRLVFPIYFSNRYRKMSCAVIYSDDHGETWKRGASPNDGRKFQGKILSAETLSEEHSDLTESQVVEMPNGDLHIYMRNHSRKQRTAIAKSKDGGETWSQPSYVEELIDPTCQSSIIAYPDQGDGKTRLIFSNPADPAHRQKGTVRLSEDGGKTWPYKKRIVDHTFMYSCLTVLSNGEIGLLYETSSKKEDYTLDIEFVKFTLDWLKS